MCGFGSRVEAWLSRRSSLSISKSRFFSPIGRSYSLTVIATARHPPRPYRSGLNAVSSSVRSSRTSHLA